MKTPPDETTLRIAEAVSDVVGTPIEELPPLSEVINPEAVAALVAENHSQDVRITFSYAGVRVLVHSGATVYVRPIQPGRSESTVEPSFVD